MKKRLPSLFIFLAFSIWFYWILPSPLFTDPYASILLDNKENLLSASIAKDEQWRFPEIDSLPSNLSTCILHYEDEYFYNHPGINPFSILRAIKQNLKAGRVISGGSTITMQVIRLSRKNPRRTYFEKIYELILALRLEFSYTKTEILNIYASHAPYGGNVVGAETASWRYFKRPIHQLSWSESALLAVLPNSPSLLHPGRNRDELLNKRNKLLLKLLQKNVIDSMTYSLSLMEEIPLKPNPLPSHAFHLLQLAKKEGKSGQRITSQLDGQVQQQLNQRLNNYVKLLSQNQVHNACAMVVSLKDNSLIAYAGNSSIKESRSPYVDIIQARRSSGSILKPLLYGRALEKGLYHPRTLVKDIPITLGNFAPHNFNGEFEGVVRSGPALFRSLNVPATLILKEYGLGPFYEDLQSFGFSTINRSADNYGLTLILGGAEVSLWDLCNIYSRQAINLRNLDSNSSQSKMMTKWKGEENEYYSPLNLDRGSWWLITQTLTNVQRPGINSDWRKYTSSRKIAWKTGTSHGFRDAWAVGYDRDYLIGVWVGNVDGEGRPGLTGVSAAGPLLFDLFQLLPRGSWFEKPEAELKKIKLCRESGMMPTPYCPKTEVDIPIQFTMNKQCTYHKNVLLDEQGDIVYRDCAKGRVKDSVLFRLPPVEAYYYTPKNSWYRDLPQLSENCKSDNTPGLAIIYPQKNSNLIIPINLKKELEKVELKATHEKQNATLYWHLDDKYLGKTDGNHELTIYLQEGQHVLTIMDNSGNKSSCNFRAYLAGQKP